MSSALGLLIRARYSIMRTMLGRNRNFALLWSGEVLSETGSQVTTIAMPLLVLFLTGSAAQAGLIGFARSLAYPLTVLFAGVIADRIDRRRLMIICAIGRAVAIGSVALALALGRPSLAQLLVVTFLDATLFAAAQVAERGLITEIVPAAGLADAVTLNEARTAVAVLSGPAIGGALFGVGRGLPFLADTASFLVALLSLLGVRVTRPTDRAGAPRSPAARGSVRAQVVEGMGWLWQEPFLRAGSLFYAAANVTIGAVELLGLLIARRHGASSAEIGGAFAIVGAGGLVGAALAGPLRRRVSARRAVLAEPWFAVLCVPLLLVLHAAPVIGGLIAVMFLPMTLSSSVVVGRRLALTPDGLRGRVQASASFIAGSIAWIGPLTIGVLVQYAGESAAVLTLSAWTLTIAVTATVARGLRDIPELSS
jgi:hypothetical protein